MKMSFDYIQVQKLMLWIARMEKVHEKKELFIRIGSFCPKLRYFIHENGPKGRWHENEF